MHAADPDKGVERLDEGDISAVILDHYLQGSTGLDFLRRLKQRHLHVPVVYVTGSSEATIADVGWELFHFLLDVASGRKKTWAEQWKLHNALTLFNPAPVT